MALNLEPAADEAPAQAPRPRIAWTDGMATDDTGRVVALQFACELGEPWAAWLAARASAYGETVGEHAAAILRAYWAHHDQWRHQQGEAATRPVAR